MTTDDAMRVDYTAMLKQLQAELDGLESHRSALEATIAGLKRLVAQSEDPGIQQALELPVPAAVKNGRNVPPVPPGFFTNKTPTQAYRDFIKLWPGDWTPPQIADAFEAGGMQKARTDIIQQVHSVLKRERERARKKRESEKAATAVNRPIPAG